MNEVLKSNGIKYGVITGIIAVLGQVLLYILGNESYKSPIIGIVLGIIYWIVRIFQSIDTKKQMKGIITFKESFTTLFICILIGISLSSIFNYVFLNFIVESSYRDDFNTFLNLSKLELYKAMGKSSSELKEVATTDNFSIAEIGFASIFSIIVSSIFNLILAAIFKSKTNPLNE